MKTTYKIYLLSAVMATMAGQLTAQDMNSSYFLDGYSYRHDMNPAYGNEYNYSAIPIIGNLNVHARGSMGVGDIFFKNPDYGIKPGAKRTTTFMHPGISADEALSGLDKDRNTLILNVDIPIASVGFGAWDGYNTIELRERTHVGVSVPYEFFEFAKNIANKNYSFEGLNAKGWSYLELGFGHSRQLFDNLRVGAKVKFLIGVAYADISMNDVRANLQGDHWVVEGKARAEVNLKGAYFQEKSEEYKSRPGTYYNKVDKVKVDGGGLNGFGLGFDIGGIYEFKDCSVDWLDGLKASLSLTDIGFVTYTNKIVAESSGKPFTFDGFTNIAVKDASATAADKTFNTQKDELSDKLKDFANLEKTNETGNNTNGLGATLRFGLEYPLPVYDKLKFGFLYSHRYGGEYFHWNEGRLSANYAPWKWVDGGINLAFSSFSTEMGWALNFHPRGCNVFIGMDYMLGKTAKSMIPKDSNVCFNFGVNITWNGKKDKRQLKTLNF